MTDLNIVNTKTAFDLAINEKYAVIISHFETTYKPNGIECFDKMQTFAIFSIAFFIRNDSNMITSFNNNYSICDRWLIY